MCTTKSKGVYKFDTPGLQTMNPWRWAITVYDESLYLRDCIDSIGKDEDLQIYNVNDYDSLAETWNCAMDDAFEDGYKTVIIANDDIQLFPNAGFNFHHCLHDLALPAKALMCCAYNDKDFRDGAMRVLPGDSYMPGMFCFAISSHAVDIIGYFDEGFRGCYFEDTDYIHRIYKDGYSVVSMVPVKHKEEGSTGLPQLEEKMKQYFTTNFLRFSLKWGGPVDMYYPLPWDGRDELEVIDEYWNNPNPEEVLQIDKCHPEFLRRMDLKYVGGPK